MTSRYPLYSLRLFFSVAALYTICVYGSMAVMSIGAGIVFAAWLLCRGNLKLFRHSPMLYPTIFLTSACVWSLVWSRITHVTFLGTTTSIHWLQDTAKLWHLFFPFILATVFSTLSKEKLYSLTKLWLLMGIASAIFGIIQHFIPIFEPQLLLEPMMHGSYHATGLAGFHLSFATIIAFPAVCWFVLFGFSLQKKSSLKIITLQALVCILFSIVSFFTFSKIMWVAFPLTLIIIFLFMPIGKFRYGIIGIILAGALLWNFSPHIREKLDLSTHNITQRFEIWDANWAMIKKFPIFGVGWHHNYELTHAYWQSLHRQGFESHAHDNVLDQWATTGLVGLTAYLWWCVVIFCMSLKIYQKNKDFFWKMIGFGFVGGWICLHVNGISQVNFWDAKVMHQMGWVTALTIELYRRQKEGC